MPEATVAGVAADVGAAGIGAGIGTVLGFDFGARRIGVAVGEREVGLAHPLTEIDTEETAPRFAAIARMIEEWQPRRLVVGLPLSTQGEPHALTRRAERFARQLEGRFGLPVSMVDERYSSVDAEAGLREAGAQRAIRDKRVDSSAARLILQQWFDEARALKQTVKGSETHADDHAA